jgi:hypothetical protein
LWELSSRIDLTLSPQVLRERERTERERGRKEKEREIVCGVCVCVCEREREREREREAGEEKIVTGSYLIQICTYSLARSTIS